MKKVFAIFLLLLTVYHAKSQDITISSFKAQTIKPISPSDSILLNKRPSSILKLNNPLIIRGNNGSGFDIFQSQIDHMYVLIPDKSNSNSTFIPNGMGIQNFYKQEPQLKIMLDSLSKSK